MADKTASGHLLPEVATENSKFLTLLLGDNQDAVTHTDDFYLGNGVVVRCHPATHKLEIFASITGLPAVFLYRDTDITVVASSIRHIAAVPGVRLNFDPQGLKELAGVGHPIQHRTLFEKLSIVPAGTRLSLVEGRDLEVTGSWSPADVTPFRNWPEYIDAQVAAMRAA